VRAAIGCDLDGVIFNFSHGFSELANSIYPDAPIITDNAQCLSWRWQDWYMDAGERAEEVVEGTWRDIERRGWNFWANLPLLFPKEMDSLRDAYRQWPIVFMTRRDWNYAYVQTIKALQAKGIDEPLVVRVQSGEEKSHWAKKLGISVVIEDSPKYAEELLDNGISVVLVQWPYNQEFEQANRKKYNPFSAFEHPVLMRASGLKNALTKANYLNRLGLT